MSLCSDQSLDNLLNISVQHLFCHAIVFQDSKQYRLILTPKKMNNSAKHTSHNGSYVFT